MEDNITVNTEQIMADIRRDIMLRAEAELPTFEEVRRTAGLSGALEYLQTSNQVAYYFQLGGGKLKVFLKRVMRKLMKCVLFPVVCHQNIVNQNVATALTALNEENRLLKKELAELRSQLDALKEK